MVQNSGVGVIGQIGKHGVHIVYNPNQGDLGPCAMCW